MITELLVNSVMQSKSTFVHVDAADTEEFSELKNIYIYAFSEEESEDKLLKTVDELRKNYVLAHGVVFPQWMKSEVDDIDTTVLESVVWLCQVNEKTQRGGITQEQLENIKEYHDS